MRSIHDPDTGKISRISQIWNLNRLRISGISVNRDGNDLLTTGKRDAGSHITVVEGLP